MEKITLVFLSLLAALGPITAGETRVEFPTRILPLLTKAGCNAGACHGAATGQGGFKLSLLGSDPAEDHQRITRELFSRRLNYANPEGSLLLLKASRRVAHEGGRRIQPDSPDFSLLKRWIEQGAPFGPPALAVTQIIVTPAHSLLAHTNQTVQLRVHATFSDGSREEVTSHTLFDPRDDSIATVSRTGEVTVRDLGQTSIMIRFGGQVGAARVGVPYSKLPPEQIPLHEANWIDHEVALQLGRLGLQPSQLSDDATFLRRIHLDLTGRLPQPREVEEWLKVSRKPADRTQQIDHLLQTPEFADFWTLKFADFLLVSEKRSGAEGAKQFHAWIRSQISTNRPLHHWVRDLLGSEGAFKQNPAAHFYKIASDPRDLGEEVSSRFLGVQLACARCHNHPYDRWSQSDYHHFAAFFARTAHEGDRLIQKPQGEVTDPRTGKDASPRPLLAPAEWTASSGDRRQDLIEWLFKKESPYFAEAMVNRVWKELFARGLVEPVDDLRESNPATHPELLRRLAETFRESNYDLKALVRLITSSTTYQLASLSTPGNRRDDQFLSHARARPLQAQVLADAIGQATGVWNIFRGYAGGTRSVQVAEARIESEMLDLFGRCHRDKTCTPSSAAGSGITQALFLINSPQIQDKIKQALEKQFAGRPFEETLRQLYLATLSRPPSHLEMTRWRKLSGEQQQTEWLEDLLWSLLNSREFAHNH